MPDNACNVAAREDSNLRRTVASVVASDTVTLEEFWLMAAQRFFLRLVDW